MRIYLKKCGEHRVVWLKQFSLDGKHYFCKMCPRGQCSFVSNYYFNVKYLLNGLLFAKTHLILTMAWRDWGYYVCISSYKNGLWRKEVIQGHISGKWLNQIQGPTLSRTVTSSYHHCPLCALLSCQQTAVRNRKSCFIQLTSFLNSLLLLCFYPILSDFQYCVCIPMSTHVCTHEY